MALAKKAQSDKWIYMLRFKKEQDIFEIGNVEIGGHPGELPTAFMGSIFWLGQKMVQDANQGVVDTYVASAMASLDVRPLDEKHPILKVFL